MTCAIALSAVLMTSCNEEITQIPVIESIDISPDTIAVGGTAMIQLVVKDADDENENLVYYYTTTSGAISGIGDTVEWHAPDKAGVYVAKVLIVDKDGNQANDSIRLVVVKNDTTTQIIGVAAFPSGTGTELDLAGSKVRLYTSKENWLNHVAFSQTVADGFGPIVSFSFDNVPVGEYYLDIWKDVDLVNTFNTGDYYGWYGKGDILTPAPDKFVLVPGSTKVLQVQMWVVPE